MCNVAKHRRDLRDYVRNFLTDMSYCLGRTAEHISATTGRQRLSVFRRPFYKDLVFPLFSGTDLRKSQYITSYEYLSCQARRVHERHF